MYDRTMRMLRLFLPALSAGSMLEGCNAGGDRKTDCLSIAYPSATYLEPAFFLRVYYGHIGFGGQFGTSKPIGGWPDYLYLDYSFAMSVIVRFGL